MRAAHRRAVALAKQAGALISFDPNVRLPLWNSPAECQAAIREFLPYADVVKLSDDEVEFVTGCRDEREAAEKLFGMGCRLLLVTRGTDGSAAYTPHAHAFAETLRVPVTDTTGAGDSLTRDDLAGLTEKQLADYLAFSARYASLTVQRKGAVMATLAELNQAYPQ